jgi:hypothetical protein
MQAWFASKYPERSPYLLYAISNGASLFGLIIYPFLVEPFFSLSTQSIIWTGLYLVFIMLNGFQTWRVTGAFNNPVKMVNEPNLTALVKPTRTQVLTWMGLSALGTVLLISTTSRITQEVAVVPFLWVLPLSIYLFSFVLVFSGKRLYNRPVSLIILFISTITFLWIIQGSTRGYVFDLVIYMVLLLIGTIICHGELYQRRPSSEDLTYFYLMVSIGGAVGGIIVNLIIPLVFNGSWEFQISLGFIWILMLIWVLNSPMQINIYFYQLIKFSVVIITCIIIGSTYLQSHNYSKANITSNRNFFGILSVKEDFPGDANKHRYVLRHGITIHGFQLLSPMMKVLPTGYYVEDSGVGVGFNFHPTRPGRLRIGIIGLGIGVLGVYGEPGDEYIFYEINPAIVSIAEDKYFTYLKDTDSKVDIVLGDGRISLEDELALNGSNNFDYLIVDAFNSGSIPTHLLTKEAFELYFKHLKSDGILALHLSNSYLNLRPVVWTLAESLGVQSLTFFNTTDDIRSNPSLWILLTNNDKFLTNPEVLQLSIPRGNDSQIIRPWTDDYSNLFQILK